MHYVAIGEYDKVTEITGEDEIAELYKELEKMMDDNKALMQRVVDEQVQKENIGYIFKKSEGNKSAQKYCTFLR